jgi:hypothetical protein
MNRIMDLFDTCRETHLKISKSPAKWRLFVLADINVAMATTKSPRRFLRNDVVLIAQVRASGRARLAVATSGPRIEDYDITDPDVAVASGNVTTNGKYLGANVVTFTKQSNNKLRIDVIILLYKCYRFVAACSHDDGGTAFRICVNTGLCRIVIFTLYDCKKVNCIGCFMVH